MNDKEQHIAAYIANHPLFAPYTHSAGPAYSLTWPYGPQYPLPTVEDLASELLDDTEFRSLNLGNWLGTTDGSLIAEAVGAVIPTEYGPVFELAVEGLKLAAQLQADQGSQVAGKIALAVLGVAVVWAFVAVGS